MHSSSRPLARPRSAARRLRALAGLAAVALALTACIKADVDIAVDDDGSGRIIVISAIDKDAAEDFAGSFDTGDGADGLDVGDPCDDPVTDARGSVPPGVQVEPYDQGGFCGVRLTAEFGSGDDVAATLEGLLQGVDDDLSGGSGQITLRREGEGWLFEVANDVSADEEIPAFGESLLEDAEIAYRVKLPGRQVDHNADRIEGDGTMVWELDLVGETRDRLFVRTEPGETITGGGGGGSSTLLIVGGVVIAAALLGFVVWRQTRKPTAVAGAAAVGAPMTPPGGAPVAAEATPRWDATLGAYVIDDPVHGRLVHDEATGEWRTLPSGG